MIRAFIGIPVPFETSRALGPLQLSCPIGKAVHPENLHLTLAFLDDQPEHVLRDLHEGLSDISMTCFDVRLSGLDVLGGNSPGAVAISAHGGKSLTALHKRVSQAARDVGIPLPRRRFRPHVTLNRINREPDNAGRAKLQEFLSVAAAGPVEFRADRFDLVQSRLTPSGAIYDALAVYDLGEEIII